MKMSLHEIDSEIAQIESRIAGERVALDHAINGCTNSLRNTVASPKTLLALTGIGYAMGKLMFGRSAPTTAKSEAEAAKKVGMLGMLTGVASTAISLMQPKFGVGSVAKWAAGRYFGSKSKARAAKAAPATPVRPRTPTTY
jgi:hypothetical protein